MTSPHPTSRVLLIAERPAGLDGQSGTVRRYRLARRRFDERPHSGAERFEHLKRTFD